MIQTDVLTCVLLLSGLMMSIANYSSALISSIHITLLHYTLNIRDAGLSGGLKIGGMVACSNMVGMI